VLSHYQIRVIYEEGVESVTQTIRQLYEMIEVEDERVQRMVIAATSAHLKKIEQLTLRINHLEEELSQRAGQLHQLNRTIRELNKQLREAREQTRLAREAHLATVMKNSQTSSLPPSTDPHKRTRSLRERSGKKAGWSSRTQRRYQRVLYEAGLPCYPHAGDLLSLRVIAQRMCG
jgi:septal ring factor EnvC (AmiA/AmiB activator)